MRWIDAELEEQPQRRNVERAVFDDLNDNDLDAYNNALRAFDYQEEAAISIAEEQRRKYHREKLPNSIAALQSAVDNIDCDGDLSPYVPYYGLVVDVVEEFK